jgi:ubiquinone/menaquinone biosynthesis C-methylase UbiE
MNNPYDHNAANEKKWSRRAANFDNRRYDYFRLLQRLLVRETRIKPACTFLDLGCGTGWAVRYAADLLAGNGRFVGIDLSQGMIEKAKSDSTGLINVEFHQANADDLPFDEGIFDTVICSNSFHHYLRPIEALKEVRRVLKPGGKIQILDITADDALIRWIDKRVKRREKEHVKFYSSAEYAQLFNQAGLKHVRSSRLKILYPLKVHVGEKGK